MPPFCCSVYIHMFSIRVSRFAKYGSGSELLIFIDCQKLNVSLSLPPSYSCMATCSSVFRPRHTTSPPLPDKSPSRKSMVRGALSLPLSTLSFPTHLKLSSLLDFLSFMYLSSSSSSLYPTFPLPSHSFLYRLSFSPFHPLSSTLLSHLQGYSR